MAFLIIDDKTELLELYTEVLESSEKPLKATKASSIQEAKKILKIKKISCIICKEKLPDGPCTEILDFLNKNDKSIPFAIAVSSPLKDQSKYKKYEPHILEYIDRSNPISSTLNLLEKIKQKTEPATEQALYTQVPISSLLNPHSLACDLYLKLSESKYIKIMNAGTSFDKIDYRHYSGKNLEKLYIRSKDHSAFIRKFKKEADHTLKSKNLDQALSLNAATHSIVQESIQTFGVTPEVQELIQINTKIAIETIKQNPKLKKLLANLETSPNFYINLHSSALSFLSCTLASMMPWSGETAYYKLSLAAFMHDITLKNHELAAIENLEELEKKKELFKKKEREQYKNHPIEVAELIRSIEDLPPDIDNIVLQHHEKPDGSGFPHKRNSRRISPLSTLLIIGHDIVKFLLDNPQESMQNYFKKEKEKLNIGQFRTVIDDIEKNLKKTS